MDSHLDIILIFSIQMTVNKWLFSKMGHSLPLFLYFCLFNILLFIVNSLAVTKVLLRIQCIEYSDESLS